MNFFEHQHQARRQSRRLVWLFALGIIGVVLALDAALLLGLGLSTRGPVTLDQLLARHSGALLLVSFGGAALIGIASLIKTVKLRSGGGAVARELGATLLAHDSGNPHHRRLRNVIEEIAIASGVPVPEIYVLEQELGINAFAAGYSTADAAITVTRGALEKLTRDELQGVIAHEFSHVHNGDMRLNIRLIGLLFGILALGMLGRLLLRSMSGSRNSKDGLPILLLGLVLLVVGYSGEFFGRLIKTAISRQREYLADASAVQFTRQTSGIAGALKKIGGLSAGSRLQAAQAEEVSHMLFGDGLGYSALFATHPPLLKRIRRLEPSFNSSEFAEIGKRWSQPVDVLALDQTLPSLLAAASSPLSLTGAAILPAANAELALAPAAVSAKVGRPESSEYQAAGSLRRQLPDALRHAAHDHAAALPLLLALLVDADAAIAGRQVELVAHALGSPIASQCNHWRAELTGLHPMQRLPLAAMAFPALRRYPHSDLVRFKALIEALIHADGEIQLFEYCLARLLGSQTTDLLDPAHARVLGRRKLFQCQGETAALFAVLADFGHDDARSAERAYIAGMHALGHSEQPYRRPGDWRSALDQALSTLNQLDGTGKELLIEAMVIAIASDGRLAVAEAELLRVVCALLHCPLPPLLAMAAR
ncbi:MAG: M48 family metallopeptidase [Lysobacterales bacterium]